MATVGLIPRLASDAALAGIREEVETFWLTSLVRGQRPAVLDEVRQGAGMVESLFEVVPRLYREFDAARGIEPPPGIDTLRGAACEGPDADGRDAPRAAKLPGAKRGMSKRAPPRGPANEPRSKAASVGPCSRATGRTSARRVPA